MIVKNVNNVKLNTKIASAILNVQTFDEDLKKRLTNA